MARFYLYFKRHRIDIRPNMLNLAGHFYKDSLTNVSRYRILYG